MHGSKLLVRSGLAAALLAIAAAGLIAAVAGCSSAPKSSSSTGGGSGAQQTSPAGRPLVEKTAAETYASVPTGDAGAEATAVSQLNFFDELEAMPIVSRDDALHACLLLGAGVSPSSYEQRVATASSLKWLHKTWKLPGNPREAVTTGEVSHMIVRMMGAKKRLSPNRATQRLINLGLLPERIKFNQGMSGAQLVALLGQAQDVMGSAAVRGTGGVFADLPDDDDGEGALVVASAETPPTPPSQANGTADPMLTENRSKARPEPLPEVRAAEPAPTEPAQAQNPAPSVAPPAAPAPTQTKPTPWVRGQPLKRPTQNQPR